MKMKLLLPLSALALASCATTVPSHSASSQSQAAPTLADFSRWVDQRYVAPFVTGDVPTWLDLFDDDAVALHNGLPGMKGKQAIGDFGRFVAKNIRVEDMRVTLNEVSFEGNWAYTWGTFHSRLIMKSTGQPMPGHSENGKVLFLWERQSTGVWKLQVDMGNAIRGEPPR
jgi:ketosteroid isomerase-like protein